MEKLDLKELLKDLGEEMHEEIMQMRNTKIKSYEVSDIIKLIEESMTSTDLIMEGYSMASALSPIDGIALTALMRVRETLDVIDTWFDFKYPASEDPATDINEEAVEGAVEGASEEAVAMAPSLKKTKAKLIVHDDSDEEL